MKTKSALKEEFKRYLLIKRYEPVRIDINDYGLYATVKGYPVQLKDFTSARREGDNSIVRLCESDYYNDKITQGIFEP